LREQNEEEATFQIRAHIPTTFVQIKDTEVYHGVVRSEEVRKFYFYLPDSQDISEIRFQLTTISGYP
jgi:glutamate synthase domain-containing protein 1